MEIRRLAEAPLSSSVWASGTLLQGDDAHEEPGDPLLLLAEAQLLDADFHTRRSRLALLFEMRTSLWPSEVAAALLVLDGVEAFEWDGRPPGPSTAWNVVAAELAPAASGPTLTVDFHPWASLSVRFSAARLAVGVLRDLPGAGPDSSWPEHRISTGVARWESTLVDVRVSPRFP